MLIFQNDRNPAAVRHAIVNSLAHDVSRISVCSAYVSAGGTNIFTACCRLYFNDPAFKLLPKQIITSFDYGITEPEAIRIWQNTPNTQIYVAGAVMVRAGSLTPVRAFHPKMYLFFFPADVVNVVIGSANLTGRGFTTNSEAIWLQRGLHHEEANAAWNNAVRDTVPLDDELLRSYEQLRRRASPDREIIEIEPLPKPALPSPNDLPIFPEAIAQGQLRPEAFDQMWVEAAGLQGGSGNQLELPRGAHRFFHYAFNEYQIERVARIGMPELVSGARQWDDRPLTWHGHNDMERINLPTRRQGGFNYQNSLILFRRLGGNTFELAVAVADSDLAKAWQLSARDSQQIYRAGVRRTARLAGFI